MKIGIIGAAGRMGKTLIREVSESAQAELAAATEHAGSDAVGKDAGTLAGLEPAGIAIGASMEELFTASDAVIDFTRPEVTLECARIAADQQKIHVIGTTGLSADQQTELMGHASRAVIVQSANMSIGVNLLASLVEKVSGILDEEYDIEIVEMHHRHKVDAPSGTALLLGKAAAEGRDVALDKVWCKARDGHTGERPAGEIGFATLRGGDVVGDHTVMFAGPGERLELTHKAADRRIFSRGALRCALWAQTRSPGYYTMRDVLGL